MRGELLQSEIKFQGKRLLLAAKEAGAGSLLAEFAKQWQLGETSAVIVSSVAATYFANTNLRVISENISDEAISELLAKMKPDKVVIGASAGASVEKRVLRAAQAAGIAVHAFVDHYWNLWQRFADPLNGKPWSYLPEHIHVPAIRCLQRLVELGYLEKQISIFSHPLLTNNKYRRELSERQQWRRALNIPDNAIVALFVSECLFPQDPLWDWDQAYEEDYSALLKKLLLISAKKALSFPIIILIRCHPGESENRWQLLCESVDQSKWRNVSRIPKDSLFDVTDIVFGINSMMLTEAAAAGLSTYSYHAIKMHQTTWLSTITQEIIELSDENSIEEVFNAVLPI